MRKLIRIRTKGIPKAFRGDKRVDQMLTLLKKEREIKLGQISKHEFPSTWSPCKKQLHKESLEKCAYCESPTTVISYGDVEHYRPKSKYWWLAYCYDNYLASCTLCNQKYKKAKFDILNQEMTAPTVLANNTDSQLNAMVALSTPDPITENEGMLWVDFIAAHKSERPLLLNPYIDDPNDYFAWEVDHVDGYVKLIPLDQTDDLQKIMVKASEKDFGINRVELCKHRYDTYIIYCGARLMSEDNNIPQVFRVMQQNLWDKLIKAESAYSGMLNYFESKASDELSLPF